MTSFGNGEEDTSRSVTTVEWSSVSAPVDLNTWLLQGEEHYKSANGDSARERGGSDAERNERLETEVGLEGRGHALIVL